MNLREVTSTNDPMARAHLLCARGDLAEAREVVEGVLARQPANRQAYELLDEIVEKQRFRGVQAEYSFDLANSMAGAWGWLLKIVAVGCWIGALAFLVPILLPDRINRHPAAGEPVVQANYYRDHDTIPKSFQLFLFVGLVGAGAGLWQISRRFVED